MSQVKPCCEKAAQCQTLQFISSDYALIVESIDAPAPRSDAEGNVYYSGPDLSWTALHFCPFCGHRWDKSAGGSTSG